MKQLFSIGKKAGILSFAWIVVMGTVSAQKSLPVQLINNNNRHEVSVTIGGKPFTTFLYNDTLYKPVLYPVYSPAGTLVTRGFPLAPRPGEPTDHPHHEGIWFNYENVNGIDFWNNSYAIAAKKKPLYGTIKTTGVSVLKNKGIAGEMTMTANWTDAWNNRLLTESTTFIFSGNSEERTIERVTTLTAVKDVVFSDAKDGLLGMRVTKELQIPSTGTKKFTDDKGHVTLVKAGSDATVNGNYITSEGKEGDEAWATRGNWCLLYGKKNHEMISIAIVDHPKNIGYPTYWHARGYGLFAANPLGQKIFSNGKKEMNFTLKKGQSVTFRYLIVIAGGKERLSKKKMDELAKDFGKK